MKVIIHPSKLKGNIDIPSSKSFTHRAIILSSLATGNSIIKKALISDDTKATIHACKLLGAKIKLIGKNIEIMGTGGNLLKNDLPLTIDCHQSGTTIRLMTAVCALSSREITLTGDKSLRVRPIGELVRVLQLLGINISASNNNQLPPVRIKSGNFKGGKINIHGDVSSQFLSALLIIAPFADDDLEITVYNLKSAPYVDITIDMMKTFGVRVKRSGNSFFIKSGQKYVAQKYTVEGDYSSASYFLAAEVLNKSNININNLNSNTSQGDKYFFDVLKIFLDDNNSNIVLDLEKYPDIVPTVSILAACKNGTTIIKNVSHLRQKESDRLEAVSCELRKMGIDVKTDLDSITITGGKLKGAKIDTHNDHRIAMSFAIAGLVAEGVTTINNAEVVNKSYPNFWKDLINLGAKIEIIT